MKTIIIHNKVYKTDTLYMGAKSSLWQIKQKFDSHVESSYLEEINTKEIKSIKHIRFLKAIEK